MTFENIKTNIVILLKKRLRGCISKSVHLCEWRKGAFILKKGNPRYYTGTLERGAKNNEELTWAFIKDGWLRCKFYSVGLELMMYVE